jgi:two-component system, OmpR family, phosphate regulon response regulator PhoB
MNLSAQTILVVEDDAMVLTGLQMVLESWGVRVLAAQDMDDVVRQLAEAAPDLILSDLRLRAGLSGFDVVDCVHARCGTSVPAMILTGETGRPELEEGRRRGFYFLHKPIQASQLRQAVAAALDAAAAV